MIKVHYIFDPMCGWCFGATSLIKQLQQMDGVQLQLHPGGMMQSTPISADFRQHILAADKNIERQTGQTFGERYLQKVASGEPLTLDSYLTAQAIIAAENLAQRGFEMLQKIQQAHYQLGLAVNQSATLDELAQQLNLETGAWNNAMQLAAGDVDAAVNRSRQMMQQFALGGFPSLVVDEHGHKKSVAVSQFYRRPQEWQTFWQDLVQRSADHA